jgi:hypothetical protein
METEPQHVDGAVRILSSMPALLPEVLPIRTLGLLAVLLVCASLGHADEATQDTSAAAVDQAEPRTGTQAYVRFQELARALPPADASRAFAFQGRILRDGAHAGTWAMQARPDGKVGDWRIEEIIRIDGELVARRKGLYSKTLYPIHGSAILQRGAGTTALTWRGEDDELVLEQTAGEDKLDGKRQRFGGVALSGLAPYVLLGTALREHAGRYRTTHVYDGLDGPPQVAARDLRIERDAPWGDKTADLLVFAAPWPATVALAPDSGTLLGFRVPTKGGALEVVPFQPTAEAASAWDLLTNPSVTAEIATLRFLYALERGYLTLAESLVAWPPGLAAPATPEAADTEHRRRVWIEARRIELLADLPPERAGRELQALLPRLVVEAQEATAHVRLPAPYAGWVIECRRVGPEEWRVAGAVHEPEPASK